LQHELENFEVKLVSKRGHSENDNVRTWSDGFDIIRNHHGLSRNVSAKIVLALDAFGWDCVSQAFSFTRKETEDAALDSWEGTDIGRQYVNSIASTAQ
jgi:hypothetical protein